MSEGDTSWGVAVTGTVDGGTANSKWYRSTAECRGVSAPVSSVDGTFTLPGVPLYLGENALVVTVTDVSGNSSQQTRTVTKTNNALETFAYDNNGNLTNWVNGTTNWVYQWDWADRLTKATSNNVVVLENWYDTYAHRIAKKEVVDGQTSYTLYLSDGWDIVAVANQSAQVMETFTRGVGLAGDVGTIAAVTHHIGSTTNGTFYVHNNHRGDVVQTRSGTATTGSLDYSAFGVPRFALGPDVCRFKFSSKERDAATGFSNHGYRFYSPPWQRWVSSDPLGEAGGVNLYSYTFNNPILWVDAYGLYTLGECADICGDAISGAGQGLAAAVDGAIPFLDPLGSAGLYDPNDPTLQKSQTCGAIASCALSGAGALRGGAALGASRTGLGKWLNSGKNWRLGPGNIPKGKPFTCGPGQNVPTLRIGNWRPDWWNHFDLRMWGY